VCVFLKHGTCGRPDTQLTPPPQPPPPKADKASGTWRLVWTTEKETLWIIKNAGLFGTKAGEVYQVRAAQGALGCSQGRDRGQAFAEERVGATRAHEKELFRH
jgi:hypothetical protein